MKDYIARMIQEHAQLTERLNKLEDYVYGQNGRNDNKVEFANKCVQLRGMRMYHDALTARLNNAGIITDCGEYLERVTTLEEENKPTDEE